MTAEGEKLLVFDPQSSFSSRITSLVDAWREPFGVSCFNDFRSLAEAIEHGSDHLVLVAVVNEEASAELTRIRIIHEEYPGLPVVLILPKGLSLEPSEIVRVGAIELLPDDVENDQLDRSLIRATRIGRTAIRLPHADEPRPQANTVAVLSPVGGTGRTFIATNMATWLHEKGYERVCLVDLAGPYGAVATALRLKADYTVTQACRATNDRDELIQHLQAYTIRHSLGFDVLAAGDDPLEWLSLTPQSVRELIDILSQLYDAVVIDSPSGVDEIVNEIIGRSTTVFVVGTLDVPTLRAIRLFLEQLQLLGVDDDQRRIILNRVSSGLGIELDEALDYLGFATRDSIPAHDDVRRSINLGKPLLGDQPKHSVSKRLNAAFSGVEVTDGGDSAAQNASANGGRRLLPLLPRLSRAR